MVVFQLFFNNILKVLQFEKPFQANVPFYIPWKHQKTSQNNQTFECVWPFCEVFWCFQAVYKGNIGLKWVKFLMLFPSPCIYVPSTDTWNSYIFVIVPRVFHKFSVTGWGLVLAGNRFNAQRSKDLLLSENQVVHQKSFQFWINITVKFFWGRTKP